MIPFSNVPSSRVPFMHVEFDSSKANQGDQVQPYKSLTLGQMLSSGTHSPLVPIQATNADDVGLLFGKGSQIHGMAQAMFDQNKISEAWFCGIVDNGVSKAAGSITIGGAATAAGTLEVYVAGRRLSIPVTVADTVTSIAAAIAAAIAAHKNIPVSATSALGVVTITALNAGTQGNAIDIRSNFNAGEELPAGVTFASVAMSGGATNIDFDDFVPVLGDEHYNIFALGWDDTSNIAKAATELLDRWMPIRQIEAMAFISTDATHSSALTMSAGINSQNMSILPIDDSPTPPWEISAILAGIVTLQAQTDPGRPFQTLPMTGAMAPVLSKRWTFEEAKLLLDSGMSTYTVDQFGQMKIGRLITTYQLNAAGVEDASFLDVNTPLTLGFIRWSLRGLFSTKYPRHKLADDGTRFAAGQPIMTPSLAKAEILVLFRQWESQGLVEGVDQFKKDLIVVRSSTDPNRLDIQLSPDLVNQLRVVGALVSFLI